MTIVRRLIVPILAVSIVAACTSTASSASQNSDADVKAIDAVREHEMALVSGPNMDSIGTVYTDDVDFMPPGEPAIQGVDNVKKWAQGMMSQMNVSGKYTSSHVTVAGDIAVDRYTVQYSATPKAGGPTMDDTFKGVHVFKRQPGGGWKIALDTWNSDKAEQPPAPAPDTKKQPSMKK